MKESVRNSKSIPLRVSVWDSKSKRPNFQFQHATAATPRYNSKITWILNISIPHFIILTLWTRRALERPRHAPENQGRLFTGSTITFTIPSYFGDNFPCFSNRFFCLLIRLHSSERESFDSPHLIARRTSAAAAASRTGGHHARRRNRVEMNQ